jgi:hypothetical protein
VVVGEQDGEFVPTRQHIRLELREIVAEPGSVKLGNVPAVGRYDPAQRRLIVDLHETASSQVIDLSIS